MNDLSDEEIYLTYPRKIAKISALKAIRKAVKDLSKTMGEQMARETILSATQRFAASPAGNKGQFTPHCASWMNAGRYLDDPAEWYVGQRFEPGIFHGAAIPDSEVEILRRRMIQ